MTGLKYLITEPEGEGAGWLRWVLADEVQGVVMEGGMGAVGSLVGMGTGTGTGTVLGGGVSAVGSAVGSGSGSVSAATATQSVSIVGVEELDSL